MAKITNEHRLKAAELVLESIQLLHRQSKRAGFPHHALSWELDRVHDTAEQRERARKFHEDIRDMEAREEAAWQKREDQQIDKIWKLTTSPT